MLKTLNSIGPLIANAGLVVALVSGVIRLMGYAYIGTYETISFFVLGLGLMVAACAIKLYGKD
ncbi:MAG: hypothetical protein Q8R76_09535 [Candidatus Omnitrophota bacterium]|nr:hypothetical protein [Candidatus Omnitrophota bacterium]